MTEPLFCFAISLMCFIQTLLESFLLFLSAPNIEDVKDTYEEYMDTWLQSHLPLLNEKHFSMFRLIFEKSIVTSLVNRNMPNPFHPYVLIIQFLSSHP